MSFIADIFGAAVDAGTSLYNAKVQRQINEQNHTWALEAENRERLYNSPVAQMQRLKAAGLNPNLIYGSGASTGNLNSRTSTADAPQLSFNALDRIRAMREGMMQKRQIENLDVQNELTRAQTEVAGAQKRISEANADIAEHDARVVASRPNVLSGESPLAGATKPLLDDAMKGFQRFRTKAGQLVGKVPLLRDLREWWFSD